MLLCHLKIQMNISELICTNEQTNRRTERKKERMKERKIEG